MSNHVILLVYIFYPQQELPSGIVVSGEKSCPPDGRGGRLGGRLGGRVAGHHGLISGALC